MPHHQVCPRCHAVWAVGAAPAVLCPRCGGHLSAPTITSAAPMVIPPPGRFRWVVIPPTVGVPPADAPSAGRESRPRPPTPTPSYGGNPGWTLQDPFAPVADAPYPAGPSGIERWARWASPLLLVAAGLYIAAAMAEFLRYGVLVHNRTHLIPPWLAVVSDALVWLTAPVAVIVALVGMVAATCRLIVERTAVFEVIGRTDPRSVGALAVGCLLPVVNWVYPGIFLTELDRSGAIPAAHRFTEAIRWWWGLWIVGWAALITQVLLRRRDGLQAAADGVLFSAITDLVAAAVAVATVIVFRRIRDEAIDGGPRPLRRWVISVEGDAMVDKAKPGAIAPVGGSAAPDGDASAPDDDASEPEQALAEQGGSGEPTRAVGRRR